MLDFLTYNDSVFLNETATCETPLPWTSVMVVANLLSTITGIFGNFLVCLAVWKTASLHTTINYYMVSLAVADLMVTLIVQPLMVAVILGKFTGYLGCESTLDVVYRAIGNFSCAASFINLCFISLERFLAVLRPFNTYIHGGEKSKRFILFVAASWLIPLVYTLLRVTSSRKATSLFSAAIFGLGYIWMICCYAIILVFLHLRAGMTISATDTRQRKTQRKITITMVLVIACYTIMWLPFFYFRLSGNSSLNSGYIYELAITMALCHSSFNPIIYSFRNKKYRKAFKSILFAGRRDLSTQTTKRTTLPQSHRKLSSDVRKMSLGQTPSLSTPLSTPPTERRNFIVMKERTTNV